MAVLLQRTKRFVLLILLVRYVICWSNRPTGPPWGNLPCSLTLKKDITVFMTNMSNAASIFLWLLGLMHDVDLYPKNPCFQCHGHGTRNDPNTGDSRDNTHRLRRFRVNSNGSSRNRRNNYNNCRIIRTGSHSSSRIRRSYRFFSTTFDTCCNISQHSHYPFGSFTAVLLLVAVLVVATATPGADIIVIDVIVMSTSLDSRVAQKYIVLTIYCNILFTIQYIVVREYCNTIY
jgi:hypothetical protein